MEREREKRERERERGGGQCIYTFGMWCLLLYTYMYMYMYMYIHVRKCNTTYVAFSSKIGIGAHVKKTARIRKDFLPQASESAPIRGAERNDSIP